MMSTIPTGITRIDREEARTLATVEFERFAALVASLSPTEWETDTDCVVIASHRPGLQDYLLGSTAARVVRHAACSVHVLR